MLNTMSKFYFGHFIDQTNNKLSFNDGTADKVASLNPGDYSLSEFIVEVARAMNAASNNSFNVSVNRTTRLVTISSGGNFELQISSGASANPYSLLGFTGSDLSGNNTYTGTNPSGSQFLPQVILQGFIDFSDDQQASYSNIARSADGTTEAISFGTDRFMTCEIVYQTNKNTSGSIIENQPNGADNLRTFMEYITQKRKIEFLPNRDAEGFVKCIIETTNSSGKGTGFRLKEYLSTAPGYFSSGKLKFREIL